MPVNQEYLKEFIALNKNKKNKTYFPIAQRNGYLFTPINLFRIYYKSKAFKILISYWKAKIIYFSNQKISKLKHDV